VSAQSIVTSLRVGTAVGVAAIVCACGSAEPGGDVDVVPSVTFAGGELAAAGLISADNIRAVVAEIAADEYAGRGPGTAGDRAAREFLAERLARAGFEPGGRQGRWEQPFDLIGVSAETPAIWRFATESESLQLAARDEFIAASGVQQDRAMLDDAEVVFVGYGIEAPEFAWNDFKAVDLEGKVLLMLNNDPDWDPDLFAGNTRLYYGRWTYKYESAARQGAAGAIIIHTTPSAGYPWQVVQTSWSNTQFELPAGDEPRLQVAGWLTEDAARRLVGLADLDLDTLITMARDPDFEPVPLGVTTSLTLTNEISRVTTANVLGLLPGSDPAIADEVVIFMAHHDHLGVASDGPAEVADTDRIYNGARDNASGVGMVAAIADAFGALPEAPRRSILVAFVGAEEQGLLGSRHFGVDSIMPTGKMAAVVNFDAGNIWGRTRDVSFIGFGKSTLDDVALAIGEYTNRTIVADQYPDRGYFYRSDQFSLARVGVPGMYLRGGRDYVGRPENWGEEQLVAYEREHYHQPSDELTPDWNFDGLVEDARFGFLAGLTIAAADEMPTWHPGDEFEAARRAALQAAP
jgi:Zn-dependent M28 family amino/carboxypeptidase